MRWSAILEVSDRLRNRIRNLRRRDPLAQASLKDLRIATFCTLDFAGFFRFNEIHANHLIFMESCAKIFVPCSKTDVYNYREGNYVFIAKSNSKYCPVNLLARYMKEAKIDPRCSLPISRCREILQRRAHSSRI